jgi:site-specific DNA-methyltransferase (adenine-specific)
MRPYYESNNIEVYHGDLREVLPSLIIRGTLVDSVCTDPPYGLSFMGKGWDHAVPDPRYWRAIDDVCKPGANMLAFGGTRTWHRLASSIEDAGWEIRDCLMWLYGQGFPKAGDIGKLIDKEKGAVRPVVGTKLGQPGYSLASIGRTNNVYGGSLDNPAAECAITAPATDLAKRFTGWAAALKPAWEPIVLAMKALDGTQAHNAEVHGVAGLNIDACRIKCDGGSPAADRRASAAASGNVPLQGRVLGVGTAAEANQLGKIGRRGSAEAYLAERPSEQLGRYPANLLLDEEAAAQLDAQTGTLKSGKPSGKRGGTSGDTGIYGSDSCRSGSDLTGFGDSGGASRFFYVGKATKKERGPGNGHATVKPLALMKYLLTLLSTPTGGLILDPFAGSGTTAVAAKLLGRPCIAIELEEHNCEIIAKRLEATCVS